MNPAFWGWGGGGVPFWGWNEDGVTTATPYAAIGWASPYFRTIITVSEY